MDLDINYQSYVDPRLNSEQSIELAFEIAQILNEKNKSRGIFNV
jgi:3-deoxy-D-arabino-heptulosonate 7-phosphate (DAHP) synthase class II